MSYAVSAIEGVRDGATARSAKLAEKDPLRSRLQQLSDELQGIRSKIVATKEGGGITGEERIREHLGGLYGDVNGYEGRPTDYQVARVESLGRELEDVILESRTVTEKELPAINASLQKKKLEAISVLTEAHWEKQHEESSTKPPGIGAREMD